MITRLLVALLAIPALAHSQAAPNNNLTLIGYNSLKTRVKPTGELATQVATIDSAIRAATQRGETAEVRHLIARATALLNNRVWADTNDYRQSLVLRADRLVVDPTQPYSVRLEQTYAPSIVLAPKLQATATIRPASNLAPRTPLTAPRTLVSSDAVARDLRDQPLHLDLDLANTPAGSYIIDVQVSDSTHPLGAARLAISVVPNIDARLKALDAAAANAPADLQADIRYPGDVVRKVNHGIVPLGAFPFDAEVASAESITVVVAGRARTGPRGARAAENAFEIRKGRFARHYWLESAGEIMPYGIYIPTKYDGTTALPLVIALHGAGGNENSFMTGYTGIAPRLAEQHGFILATPMGYRVDGFYGSPIMNGGRVSDISEQDVMQVLALMKKNYKIDTTRIFLMGHSMGAIGTWHIGAKYPDIWAAMGEISGLGFPASVARMKAIPQYVVHGDADNTVPVQRSRDMVAEMQKLGMDYKYVELPGVGHNDAVVPSLAAMFDFFDLKKKP